MKWKRIFSLLIQKCNAELFLRYILYELDNFPMKTNRDVLEYLNSQRIQGVGDTTNISVFFWNCAKRSSLILLLLI